jgi:putative CocE/NonD family hydrolase
MNAPQSSSTSTSWASRRHSRNANAIPRSVSCGFEPAAGTTHRVRELRSVWIPLSDGMRLSARMWLPEDAEDEPVPALLEYLPYRKDDATAARDAIRHPYLAAHGYAAVRVDMRGSGDSDGLLLDEYLPQEQLDALEVIEWLAEQPWCSGAVGMFGISWGGFNALQVAARQPPALKAVIAVSATHDRFTDDVHWCGGCVFQPMLDWATSMLAYSARPPDPLVVGAGWRDLWLSRLEGNRPFIESWLGHQRRDAYWLQGSVCADYSAIRCPVYVISGWCDWYRNPVFALLEGLAVPCKGLIGPWAHTYPDQGVPGPAIGFLQESLRWWDHWLKAVENGIEDEPCLRAWMTEPFAPGHHDELPGRWIAEPAWPSANVETRTLTLTADGGLVAGAADEAELVIRGVQTAGLDSGWIFSPDQSAEDRRSLSFTSEPLNERIEVLGIARLELAFVSDCPLALASVRLCDVAPNGVSTLVTRGQLNLTHRHGHQTPHPLVPGERARASVRLDAVGRAIPPGHRLRVSISPNGWPRAWPSPEPVTLTVIAGSSYLGLPVRLPRDSDALLPTFGEVEGSEPLPLEVLADAPERSSLSFDPESGRRKLTVERAHGYRLPDGLEYRGQVTNSFLIAEDDPLSAEAHTEYEITIARGTWRTYVRARGQLTCDPTTFSVQTDLAACEGHGTVFTRDWNFELPRDHV